MIIQKTLFCGLKSSDGLQTWKNDEKLLISRHGFLLNIFGKVGAMCYICSDIINGVRYFQQWSRNCCLLSLGSKALWEYTKVFDVTSKIQGYLYIDDNEKLYLIMFPWTGIFLLFLPSRLLLKLCSGINCDWTISFPWWPWRVNNGEKTAAVALYIVTA